MSSKSQRSPLDVGRSEDESAARAEPGLVHAEPDADAPRVPPMADVETLMTAPRVPARRPEPTAQADHDIGPPPSPWPLYLTALTVSVLWGLSPFAFALGYRKAVAPLQNDSCARTVFALLAIGPAVLVWVWPTWCGSRRSWRTRHAGPRRWPTPC